MVRVSLTSIWREALTGFAARPAVLLLCAVVGLATPYILAVAFDAPPWDALIRSQATFCAFQALGGWQPWLWGSLGLMAQVFTQGLIAALVTRTAPDIASNHSFATSLRTACRTVVMHSPALLLGWLSYTLLIIFTSAGLSVPLLRLHLDPAQLRAGIGLEQSLARPADLFLSLVGREVTSQGVNLLLPDPGPLVCGMAESLQVTILKPIPDLADPMGLPVSLYRQPVYIAEAAWFWPVTLGSLVLMLLTETLFRFRSVASVASVTCKSYLLHTRCSAYAGLAGVGVAWRHFSTVMVHGGVLRLVIACIKLLFVVVPTLLAEHLVIPRVGQAAGAQWAIQICVLGVAAGVAVTSSILSAFVVVYDTRLYFTLRRAECGE